MEFFTRYGTKHEGGMHDVNEAKGTALYTYEDTCHRCGGAGGSSKWQFTGWRCFECGGTGRGKVRTEKLYSAEKLAMLNAAQAKRDAARTAKAEAQAEIAARAAEARLAEFEAANPGLIAAIERLAGGNPFMSDMARRLRELGNLTDGQLAAAKTTVGRLEAREAAKAASEFVGETGKRMEMVLTVEFTKQLEAVNSYMPRWARYAAPTIYVCRDQQGNRVVYKGTGSFGSKGTTIKVKATIDGHNVREDEKQTLIARPKLLGTLDPATGKYEMWSNEAGGMVEVA